jgi:hypothetical protein
MSIDQRERKRRSMRVRLLPSATLLALGMMTLCSCSSTEPQQAAKSEPPAAVQPLAAPTEPGPAPASPAATPATPATPTTSAASEAPADKALVTIYRKKRIVGLALHTSVYADGVEVAELENGAYVRLAIAPGPHAFHADEEKDTIKVDLEPAKQYFFRMELVPGMWKGNGVLKLIDEKTGAAEFKEWNLKLTKEIRRPEMVVRDPGKS